MQSGEALKDSVVGRGFGIDGEMHRRMKIVLVDCADDIGRQFVLHICGLQIRRSLDRSFRMGSL